MTSADKEGLTHLAHVKPCEVRLPSRSRLMRDQRTDTRSTCAYRSQPACSLPRSRRHRSYNPGLRGKGSNDPPESIFNTLQ